MAKSDSKNATAQIKFNMKDDEGSIKKGQNADIARHLDSKSGQNPNAEISRQEAEHGKKKVQYRLDESDKKPVKKKVRPLTAQERALKVKEAEINATTRWLADSSFTTYFGKPAFHAYGKGNVNPTNPTQKLLTHNINGCTGRQGSKYQQVYDTAYAAGVEKTKCLRVPKIPLQKEKFLQEKVMTGNPIMPKTLKTQRQETKKVLKSG